MEEKIEKEEDFVTFFTVRVTNFNQNDSNDKKCSDSSANTASDDAISFASMDSDEYDKIDHADLSLPISLVARSIGEFLMPSTPSSNNPSEAIVKLSIDNEIIPVKRTTLCHFKDSMFAKQFTDSDWILEHTFKSNDSTNAVLMELPTAIIKPIINQLRLTAMLNTTS